MVKNKGLALILSLIVIVVLTILGSVTVSRSVSESFLSQRNFQTTQAFWLAEAGINQALIGLRSNYGLTGISNTAFGAGGYSATITANPDGSRTVVADGFVPFNPAKVDRRIQALMNKKSSTPLNFFNNAIYSAGNIVLNGQSYDVEGNVIYAGSITGDASEIDGTVTQDPSISPLARLDFNQLRAISKSQGNYHDASSLNGPFPTSFWYSPGVPNVVFLEGNLDLTGKTQVGGFFVVGGEVTYNATISGNVSVDGAIYTLGQFTINGGGNALNVNGGVWTGQLATLNGNSKISYNSTYISAIQSLGINTDVQIISWADLQNPYSL